MPFQCKAKDPATCRYHQADAGAVALKNFNQAEKRLSEAITLPEKEKAFKEVQDAKDIYDATDEGYATLRAESRNARIDNDFTKSIECTARIVKAKIARAEERQSGVATETIFFDFKSMSQKLKDVDSLVAEGGSDRFHDIYDQYSPAIKGAIVDNDSYAFTKTYNEMMEELADEGSQSRWFDVNKGRNWVSQVRKMKIIGRVHRTLIPLDNTRISMIFDA